MIPTFPLEEERDDIEDWFLCFRDQMKSRQYYLQQQHRHEIKAALTDGLGEVGIASAVQQMSNGGVVDEEDCDFDGPAMDVILMIQDDNNSFDGDANENTEVVDDGQFFMKRSRTSLLRSQSSLYGGLYTPTSTISEEDGGANCDIDASQNDDGSRSSSGLDRKQPFTMTQPNSKSSLLSRQSSLYGGLYTPSIDEDKEHHEADDDDDAVNDTIANTPTKKPIIIGGAAVEYYRKSQVGLLSYVVLHSEFRGCGLAKYLHQEALVRLNKLANCYGRMPSSLQQHKEELLGEESSHDRTMLKAVFAETNTPEAGDITPEQSLLRHKSLYNLGYRLAQFPYAQPPLTTEDVNASFDDIVLLVYFPFDTDEIGNSFMLNGDIEANSNRDLVRRYCSWFIEETCGNINKKSNGNNDTSTVRMDINIPFQYVVDFYQSVFGYDSEEGEKNSDNGDDGGIPDFRTANYYKLAHWFTHNHDFSNNIQGVEVSLCHPATPWEDCKDNLLIKYKEWTEHQSKNT